MLIACPDLHAVACGSGTSAPQIAEHICTHRTKLLSHHILCSKNVSALLSAIESNYLPAMTISLLHTAAPSFVLYCYDASRANDTVWPYKEHVVCTLRQPGHYQPLTLRIVRC